MDTQGLEVVQMTGSIKDFGDYRQRMNQRIFAAKNLGVNRFFALDSQAYEDGALDSRTKELLGLACSMVLRCDDCITYHLANCVERAFTDDQLFDAMNVALIVGGSTVIPHLRRAVATLDELRGGC
jgi:AhpD family alkylhydroperoxidase